jgi:hypothetical protein
MGCLLCYRSRVNHPSYRCVRSVIIVAIYPHDSGIHLGLTPSPSPPEQERGAKMDPAVFLEDSSHRGDRMGTTIRHTGASLKN